MIEAGMVFKQHSGHYWFVISDPAQDAERIVCVNMTTVRGHLAEDKSCLLESGDHDQVRHTSWIFYKRSKVFSGTHLTRLITKGMATEHPPPCSASVLGKLRHGAFVSLDTPLDIVRILEEQGFAC